MMESTNNTVIFETEMNFISNETVIDNSNEGNDPNDLNFNADKKRKGSNPSSVDAKKSKYIVRPACNAKCRKECFTAISDEARNEINAVFWSLSFSERRLWLDSYILIAPVKSRTTTQMEYSRANTLRYFLPFETTKVSVCKTMFMATLGIKTDGIITEFVRAKTKPESNAATMSADLRGKTPNPRKLDDDVIRAHIMSFQPQVTHYTLENAPNRRYL